MREACFELAAHAFAGLRANEVAICAFGGERSDFVRLNGGAVRQAGSVEQAELWLDLCEGRRHARGRLALSGDAGTDRARVERLVEHLRSVREEVPEDPWLLYSTDGSSTEHVDRRPLPQPEQVLDAVRKSAGERGLVGLWAAGETAHGFASSLGQRNWDERRSFHLDFSLHLRGDKAAKGSYAGLDFDPVELERTVAASAAELVALARDPRVIAPGRYRVYLAPAALGEIVDMLSWGGFGLRAQRTKTSPLLRMVEGEVELDPRVSIAEHTAEGIAPGFESAGFLRPARVPLVEGGRYREALVSPRSSVEYGVATNGASAGEMPLSVEIGAGGLPRERALAELGTGVWISNLWYLNYSDRPACRTTGMTRFATFWVEGGRIVAPLEPMRFDESVFRMLGANLIDLTRERELLLDSGTYHARSARSARLPGALIDDFAFTL
jgi:predicted Zn-dependent protease